MSLMHVRILTMDGAMFDGQAEELAVTTESGDITILPGHEPLLTIVRPGAVHVRSETGEQTYVTFGGMLEVDGAHADLLSDEAEHSDALVEHEIEEALAHARQLVENAKDKKSLHHAQTLVDRHAVRLGVARLRRRRKH